MLRTRTKGSIEYPLFYELYHYPVSCANRTNALYGTYPVDPVTMGVGERVVTQDEVQKGYWKRKKRGDIIINYFYQLKQERKAFGSANIIQTSLANACTGPDIKDIYTYSGFHGIHRINTYGPSLAMLPLVDWRESSGLHTEVCTKALAERQSGSANFVESLAELDKTFSMLGSPLQNVTKFVRSFRSHGRRLKSFKKVKAQSNDLIVFASSEWLRFRYGITPLMNDVKIAVKTWRTQYKDVKPKLFRARSSGAIVSASSAAGTEGGSTYFTMGYNLARSQQISKRAVFYDKYIPNPFVDLGLTSQNLIGVPWELTKYSFVVDWFANVGDLMYANLPRVGVTPCGGAITTKDIKTTLVSCGAITDINSGDGWVFTGSCSDSYQMVDTVTERVGFGVADSGLVIKHDFRFDHFTRATDASALLSQVLGSISFQNH